MAPTRVSGFRPFEPNLAQWQQSPGFAMVGVLPGTCCGTANCVVCSRYVSLVRCDHHGQNSQPLSKMRCLGNQYAIIIDATILSQTHKHNFMLKRNHIESTTAVIEHLVFHLRWVHGWVKPFIVKVLQFNMFWMIQPSGDWNFLIYRICKLCELTSLAQKLLIRSIWLNLQRLHTKR